VIVNADKGSTVVPTLLPKVMTPPVPEFNVKLWVFAVVPLTAPLTVILPLVKMAELMVMPTDVVARSTNLLAALAVM
jgi:hypothetical protein